MYVCATLPEINVHSFIHIMPSYSTLISISHKKSSQIGYTMPLNICDTWFLQLEHAELIGFAQLLRGCSTYMYTTAIAAGSSLPGPDISRDSSVPQNICIKSSAIAWGPATRKTAKDCWNSMYIYACLIWLTRQLEHCQFAIKLFWLQTMNIDRNDLQMSFMVIKSGTNRKLVYYFLLVVYSCHAPFTSNLMWNSLMTLKYRQGHRQLYHLKAIV